MNEDQEFSFNDDAHSDDEPKYEWLDEWLCEYVDGTMDPALETVFEKYVEANPELKSHVENLRETRQLLGRCSELKEASRKAKARVCGQVECEMLRSQASLGESFSERSSLLVGVASSMVVALIVGFFAGAVFFSPDGANVSLSPALRSPSSSTVEAVGPRPAPISVTTTPRRTSRSAQSTLLQPLVQRAPASPLVDSVQGQAPPQSMPPSIQAP